MTKRIIVSSILAIIFLFSLVWPVSAETEITKELDAAVVGLAEFFPGDDGTIQVSIQNNNVPEAISDMAFQTGLSSYFGSAVSLSASLDKQDAPITIKSGKILVGTLPAGTATPSLPFNIKVIDSATPGEYKIKLILNYRIIKGVAEDSEDTKKVDTAWTGRTDTRELSLTIKKNTVDEQQLDFKISRVDISKFAPGDTGALQICVQNNKTIDKIDASAMQANLSQNYGAATGLIAHVENMNAPVTIKTEDILLGTLPAGQATPALPVAIEVNDDAVSGSYQMKVGINYKTLKSTSIKDGDPQMEWSSGASSQIINFEIKEKDLKFEVVKVEANLNAGAKNQILVTFKNMGAEKAASATAKVSSTSPLSMTDNTAFLGDLEPGQSSTGTFGLKVAGDAIPKEYTLDALVQYNNSKDESLISDTIKVPVMVDKEISPVSIIRNQWMSALVGAAIIVVIWIIFGIVRGSRRKRV